MQANRRKATWFNMQKLMVNNYALVILVLKVTTTPQDSHFDRVKVVLRHFHRCRYRSSPLWFFCWRGTNRSGSWLSGNAVDMKIYVVRAAGA
jgi:hypothetical protein